MLRQCLTTLLIVSYLAMGLARAPHVHALQPVDHDARAHVHCDWLTRLFDSVIGQLENHGSHRNDDPHHGHHHHHGHDHHHNADGHGHSHVPSDTPEPVPASDPDHDSTCVYVADDPHVAVPFGTFYDQTRVIAQVAILDVVVETVMVPMLIRPEWAHAPPDTLAAHRDLYLKLRTLHI